MKINLDTNISEITGIGTQKSNLLKKELRITTVENILYHFPFRYEVRSEAIPVSEISDSEEPVSLKGKITSLHVVPSRFKSRMVGTFEDSTGKIELVWFKGLVGLKKILRIGMEVFIVGKPKIFNKKITIVHPEIELKPRDHSNNIIPVYSSTETLNKRYLNSKGISRIQENVLKQLEPIPEIIPPYISKELKLMNRNRAIKQIHAPDSYEASIQAKKYFIFEEFFYFQIRILREKKLNSPEEKQEGFVFKDTSLLKKFYSEKLPFELTDAQKRVVKEIYRDMKSGYQMNRILQGDVGSGKTIVAMMVSLIAISNGYQVAMMAPTEILAEQHYNGLKPFLDHLKIPCAILSGSTSQKNRRIIHEGILSGYIKILFGTHALLEEKVKFEKLGLAIVDEQHRFGVKQRGKLWKKNKDLPPHVLVMSATPIPRTLAMTAYGSLDVSTIDQMPQGRLPIMTSWYSDRYRLKIFKLIGEELEKGRQAYIVYPLIEESKNFDYKDLIDGYESIVRAFPEYQVGVLHGQMRPEDKDFEMDKFVKNKTHIMVSTTVIEVGVNVPNATVMVIESAERFGLAQLHQLRGRVGRGKDQSYCILMSGNKVSKEAQQRLKTMVRTNDGFEIANEDLKLRGPGDILGAQQSGILNFKIADISRDEKLLSISRKYATNILEEDPVLAKEKNKEIKNHLDNIKQKELDLSMIS